MSCVYYFSIKRKKLFGQPRVIMTHFLRKSHRMQSEIQLKLVIEALSYCLN